MRDLTKIAKNYFWNGGLVVDLISCIPFFSIIGSAANLSIKPPVRGYNWLYIVYGLKIGRLYKAAKISQPRYILNIIKNVYAAGRQRYIEQEKLAKINGNEEELRRLRDPTVDRVKLSRQVVIMYLFKIFRVLAVILLLAYILGCIWFVYVMVLYDAKDYFISWYGYEQELFVEEYDLKNTDPPINAIKMTYFAFTTLSSVGFGDFYPKNTEERILMIIIFLFSLTVFSAILGYMQDLLALQDKLDAENGDRESLQRFLGVLVRYNNHLPLRQEFTASIEDYFDFYWANDKLTFIASEADQSLLAELPVDRRLVIMKNFLFADFFLEFNKYFELERVVDDPHPKVKIQHAYYRWGHEGFDEFMLEVMKSLVPRRCVAGEIILHELEEVLEMTFVLSGTFLVGYDINKTRKFVVSHSEGKVIGEYNIMFMQQSLYIVKCKVDIFGYALSRRAWQHLRAEYAVYTRQLMKKCFRNAHRDIIMPIYASKQTMIKHYQSRADSKNIVVVHEQEGQAVMRNLCKRLFDNGIDFDTMEIPGMEEPVEDDLKDEQDKVE